MGTTGYAKDILKECLSADVALVETVAHTQAALHFYPNADVICDVGGQDIKLIILKKGRVKDFRLNTQCSAGNGYFLQSTARFRVPDVKHTPTPPFPPGAFPVWLWLRRFMQSDIVDFQRQGWKPEESWRALPGAAEEYLALRLPDSESCPPLGNRFLLQGGRR